jgi:hypothetical protein
VTESNEPINKKDTYNGIPRQIARPGIIIIRNSIMDSRKDNKPPRSEFPPPNPRAANIWFPNKGKANPSSERKS